MKMIRNKPTFKKILTIVYLLATLGFSILSIKPSFATNTYKQLACRSQGATITENYFIFTDYCGNGSSADDDDGSITNVYRCDRSGTDISNCKIIIKDAHLKHANSLSHDWGSNYFWIFDGWCEPSTGGCERRDGAWCYSLNGKRVDNSMCGVKPKNFSCGERFGTSQGYAQYGEYSLKGYYNPNQIVIYENQKMSSDDCSVKVYRKQRAELGGELEDVMVDGSTGTVYYTVSGDGYIKLKTIDYKTFHLPPVANSNLKNEESSASSPEQTKNNDNSSKTKTDTKTRNTTDNSSNKTDTKTKDAADVSNDKTEETKVEETTIEAIEITEKETNETKTETESKTKTKTNPETENTPPKTTDQTNPKTTTVDSDSRTVHTTFFGEVTDDGKGCSVFKILNLVIEIMSIGVGILGVIGIMITGIMYLTAGGNEQQTTKAKRRLFEIIIGLAIYAVLFALVSWLLPGGILNSNPC